MDGEEEYSDELYQKALAAAKGDENRRRGRIQKEAEDSGERIKTEGDERRKGGRRSRALRIQRRAEYTKQEKSTISRPSAYAYQQTQDSTDHYISTQEDNE